VGVKGMTKEERQAARDCAAIPIPALSELLAARKYLTKALDALDAHDAERQGKVLVPRDLLRTLSEGFGCQCDDPDRCHGCSWYKAWSQAKTILAQVKKDEVSE